MSGNLVLEEPAVDRPTMELQAPRPGWLRAGLPLLGLALIGGLLPLRSSWAASVVLILLGFTVPGVLLLRALRVPGAALLEFPIYVPAASLAVMIASGLLIDLVGPSLGVHRPLSGTTPAIAILGVSGLLWIVGLASRDAARIRWQSLLDQPVCLVPLILPLVAAAGSIVLSAGRGTTLAAVGQVLVAVSLFGCLALSGRLSRAQVAMTLFACALAAEWAFSLRGQEIVGFDITTETLIAQHIHASGVWNSNHARDAYDAMLSLTVLPSALTSLTGCSTLIIFKVLYPVLTALLPVSVFLIGERFLRRSFAAGAASLLVVQSYFFELMPQIAREEIALIFFAALLAALLDERMRTWSRLTLVTLLGAGMVVSHYSTTYLSVPIVVVSVLAFLVVFKWRAMGRWAPALLCAAVTLIGGSTLWYGAVTHSSSNLTSFSSALSKNGLDLLPNTKGGIINSYLNGTQGRSLEGPAYESAAVRDFRKRSAYIHPLAAASDPRYTLQAARVPTPRQRFDPLSDILRWFSTIFGELMLLLGVLGSLTMVLRRRPERPIVRRIGILAIGTLGVLALIRVSATVAANYNQTRALAQSLILLALPAAWLTERIFLRLGRLRVAAGLLLTLCITMMFAFQSSLTPLLTGGGRLLNLSQTGEDAERDLISPAELAGATWATTSSKRTLLYADRYGQLRFSLTTGVVALQQVTPQTIDRHAWVYGTRTNVRLGRARGQAGSDYATYAWPDPFLNTYFDTVYTNGDSKVYHR